MEIPEEVISHILHFESHSASYVAACGAYAHGTEPLVEARNRRDDAYNELLAAIAKAIAEARDDVGLDAELTANYHRHRDAAGLARRAEKLVELIRKS